MSSLLLGLLLPLVLLSLMLVMERIERPLWVDAMSERLETFLATALPDEVETFVVDGYSSALEQYWRTRRPGLPPAAMPSSEGTPGPAGERLPSSSGALSTVVCPVTVAAST